MCDVYYTLCERVLQLYGKFEFISSQSVLTQGITVKAAVKPWLQNHGFTVASTSGDKC